MKTYAALLALTLALPLTAVPGLSAAQNASEIKQQTSPAGIKYVAGGIGEGRKNAMEALRKDYNVRLTFARPKTGDYLADVKVVVENSKNEKLLDVVSPGPFLYASLPDGSYTVTAMFEGKRQMKKVIIHDNRPMGLVYYFPKK